MTRFTVSTRYGETTYHPEVGKMGSKIRKQIYVEADQNALLKRLAKQTGMTEAEIIRQAIDHQMHLLRFPRRNLQAWQAERAFIQQMMERGSATGERTWRRETLYE